MDLLFGEALDIQRDVELGLVEKSETDFSSKVYALQFKTHSEKRVFPRVCGRLSLCVKGEDSPSGTGDVMSSRAEEIGFLEVSAFCLCMCIVSYQLWT